MGNVVTSAAENSTRDDSSSSGTIMPNRDAAERRRRQMRESQEVDKLSTAFIVGVPKSGKSVLINQFRIIYHDGLSGTRKSHSGHTIRANLVAAIASIVKYIRLNELEVEDLDNLAAVERCILRYQSGFSALTQPFFEEEVEVLLKFLHEQTLRDILDELQEGWNHHKYGLSENGHYFVSQIPRITSAGYFPTERDVIRSYYKNAGITPHRVLLGNNPVRIHEVAGSLQPSKWLHVVENQGERCEFLLVCVPLGDYDVVEGDDGQTRLETSLSFFKKLTERWSWRQYLGVLLIMTKLDLFTKKLPHKPLSAFFSDYAGGNNVESARGYILRSFMRANRSRRAVYPYFVNALDSEETASVFQDFFRSLR